MFLTWHIHAFAGGLERIMVENYYVADSIDATCSNGKLPVGAVTYRVFVDLKPGYRVQAVYGVPGHTLEVTTSTFFYNHEEYGAVTANGIMKKDVRKETTLLDSYLSMGAASDGNFAVLKTADTSAAISNFTNCLNNADPAAGIPLKQFDGLQSASPIAEVVFFGLDSLVLNPFRYNETVAGQQLVTDNGSWASLIGSAGLDTANVVMIAQLTTNGVLTFKLNLQLVSPGGGVENYVWENAVENEILSVDLVYPKPVIVTKSKAGKKKS